MTREQMVDLLRSLSRIEGAAMATSGRIEEVVRDEIEWAVELLSKQLKEKG